MDVRATETRAVGATGRRTRAATSEERFWSIVVGAAAEASVKSGAPVRIDDLLRADDIEL